VIEVPVTFSEAAMGAGIEIPTPDGERVTVKVPAGTTDGKLLRVKGRGAPKLKGEGAGDMLVRVRIAVPSKVSKQERETLEKLDELQRASHGDPRDKLFTGGGSS
jgi:DnaJ-class molecular chaperone